MKNNKNNDTCDFCGENLWVKNPWIVKDDEKASLEYKGILAEHKKRKFTICSMCFLKTFKN